MDLVQTDRGLTGRASGDDSKSTRVGFLLRGNLLDVHNARSEPVRVGFDHSQKIYTGFPRFKHWLIRSAISQIVDLSGSSAGM